MPLIFWLSYCMEMYHITIMLENHPRFMCCTAEVDQEGLENSLLKALKKDSGSNVSRASREWQRRTSGAVAGGLTISLSDHRLYWTAYNVRLMIALTESMVNILLLLSWQARQALPIWRDKNVPKRSGIPPDSGSGRICLCLVIVDSHFIDWGTPWGLMSLEFWFRP